MKIDLDAESSQSGEGSGRATRHRRKGRGNTPIGEGVPARGTPTTPIPSLPAAMGIDENAGIAESPQATEWEWPAPAVERAMAPHRFRMQRVCNLPTAAEKSTPYQLCRDLDSDGETRTTTTTCESPQMAAHPASGMDPREGDPRMANDPEDTQAGNHLEDYQEEDHQAENHQTEDHLADHQAVTPHTDTARSALPRVHLEMERGPQGKDRELGARGADQQDRDQREYCCRRRKSWTLPSSRPRS